MYCYNKYCFCGDLLIERIKMIKKIISIGFFLTLFITQDLKLRAEDFSHDDIQGSSKASLNEASKISILKKELAEKLLKESLKKLYFDAGCINNEREIIDRFLECLALKWQYLGEFARAITPADLQEVHYIVTGNTATINQLSQEEVKKEFVQLNEIIFNKSNLPMSAYEREKIQQDGYSQYNREMAVYRMWEAINLSKK